MTPLPDPSLDQLFRNARTHNAFSGTVDEATLRRLYDLLKLGPTDAHACPARFVCVTSPQAKDKLRPALSEGNLAKTMAAPVTVIVGHDLRFYDKLPVLFPHADAKSWFEGSPEERLQRVALRGSRMQAAYLIGHGGNEVVKVGARPLAQCQRAQVRVKLHAAPSTASICTCATRAPASPMRCLW